MFQVSVEETFGRTCPARVSSKCENVHGHNYRVAVTLEGPQLDSIGSWWTSHAQAVDPRDHGQLDHQFMNDLDPSRP